MAVSRAIAIPIFLLLLASAGGIMLASDQIREVHKLKLEKNTLEIEKSKTERELGSRIRELESERDLLSKENEKLRNENERLKEEIKSLEEEIKRLERARETLMSKISELERRVEEMGLSRAEEIEDLREELRDCREELKSKEKEIESLRRELYEAAIVREEYYMYWPIYYPYSPAKLKSIAIDRVWYEISENYCDYFFPPNPDPKVIDIDHYNGYYIVEVVTNGKDCAMVNYVTWTWTIRIDDEYYKVVSVSKTPDCPKSCS